MMRGAVRRSLPMRDIANECSTLNGGNMKVLTADLSAHVASDGIRKVITKLAEIASFQADMAADYQDAALVDLWNEVSARLLNIDMWLGTTQLQDR
jgi:hypothetical protein